MSETSLATEATIRSLTPARKDSERLWLRLAQLLLLMGILAVWEFAVRLRLIDAFSVSSPSAIGQRLYELTMSGEIFVHTGVTATEMLGGFLLGAILGILGGIVLALMPRLSETLDPFIVVLNGLPRAALAPLFVFWLGIGLSSKIAIAASIVFFICLFATYTGMKNTDRMLLRAVEALGATQHQLLVKVRLPSTVPWILTALKASVGMALIGAVIGELVAASRGLGWYIAYSAGNFDTTGMFAGLVALGVMAIVVDSSVAGVGKRFTRWRSDTPN
jgi:NitT/TauT family transport system permease protein